MVDKNCFRVFFTLYIEVINRKISRNEEYFLGYQNHCFLCIVVVLYMKEVLGDLFIREDAEASVVTTEGGKH